MTRKHRHPDPSFSDRGRRLKQRVATAKGRPLSSTLWLERQLNDPYVAEAKRRGYRSRAAFKLAEIDDKLNLLKPGARVLDLGAAPGGWTQVAVQRVGSLGKGGGEVVGLDLQEVQPIPGATMLQADFLAPEAPALVRQALGGPVDVVLSDMAAAATGQTDIDHLRIMNLVEAALALAVEVLKPGGSFLAKVLQGGGENVFLAELRRHFATVRRIKPPSSRQESAEFFVVATGFRGR
jgi:23S rRNA (uridine2552-2'-O)-methyltransferase